MSLIKKILSVFKKKENVSEDTPVVSETQMDNHTEDVSEEKVEEVVN